MKLFTICLWLGIVLALGAPLGARGADTTTSAIITVTNAAGTTNGETVSIYFNSTNANVYLWTNLITVGSLQLAATNTAAKSATNLYTKIAHDYANALLVTYSSATAVKLQTYVNGALKLTISTNWGTLTITTNTIGPNGTAALGASNLFASSITLGGSTITNWSQAGGGGGIQTNGGSGISNSFTSSLLVNPLLSGGFDAGGGDANGNGKITNFSILEFAPNSLSPKRIIDEVGAGNLVDGGSGGNVQFSTIFGGQSNWIGGVIGATANRDAIVGGFSNAIWAANGGRVDNSVIAGGSLNLIAPTSAASNLAIIASSESTISNRVSSGSNSVVIAGYKTHAWAGNNVLIGPLSTSTNNYVFIWSDGSGGRVNSATNNQVIFNTQNGFSINTNSANGNALEVAGTIDSTAGITVKGVSVITNGFYNGQYDTNRFWIDNGGNAVTNGPNGTAAAITAEFDWYPSGLYGAAYYQNSNTFWNGGQNFGAANFGGVWIMTNSVDPDSGSPVTPYAWDNFPFHATNRDGTYPATAISGRAAAPLASIAFDSFHALSMSAPAQVSLVPYFGFDIQNGNNWSLPPTETTFTNIINLVKANGLAALRPYLVLDTGWSSGARDGNGNIGQSAVAWPDGIAFAVGMAHSNNLYVGFHVTLAISGNGEPGTAGSGGKYIQQDANFLITSNKADYLLVDTFDLSLGNGMGANITNEQTLAESFLNYARLAACSNGIPVHMMLAANTQYPFEFQPWMARDWNSYTVSGDGVGTLDQVLKTFRQSVVQIPYTSPGHIPEFGTLGTSNNAVEFTKMEMGMTALLPANQWWGVTNFSAGIMVLLTNTDYRSVWQDPLVLGGRLLSTNGASSLWTRDLANGRKALIFLNTNFSAGAALTANWAQLGWNSNLSVSVKSVWASTNQTVTTSFSETVGTLTSDIFILTPVDSPFTTFVASSNIISGKVYANNSGRVQRPEGTVVNVLTNDYAAMDLIVDPAGGTAFSVSNSVVLFPNPYSTSTRTNGVSLGSDVPPGAAWSITNAHNAAPLPGSWRLSTYP